jgi:hypothetical protein
MAKPVKKKSTPKKAAKKPTAGKPTAAAKPTPAKKATAKAVTPTPRAQTAPPAVDRGGTTPYTPKPIDGIGWPAFRYPL